MESTDTPPIPAASSSAPSGARPRLPASRGSKKGKGHPARNYGNSGRSSSGRNSRPAVGHGNEEGSGPLDRITGSPCGDNTGEAGDRQRHRRRNERNNNNANNMPNRGANTSASVASSSAAAGFPDNEHEKHPMRRRHYPEVDPANVVRRPVPQAKDQRQFQISQLQRRFPFKQGKPDNDESGDGGSNFTISLTPTDPDFPYPIDVLNFTLTVPTQYPESEEARPSIKALNEDIPVGYKVNVERGFTGLANSRKSATLLDLLNALDKNLEKFLGSEKASTVKIVPNFDPTRGKVTPTVSPEPRIFPKLVATPPVVRPDPRPVYTAEQKAAAQAKRDLDTRQLEARLKLSNIFRKSDDGIVYTVPLEPRRRSELPVPLLSVRTVRLFVPLSFNLEPPRIELQGVAHDIASRVQHNFAKHAKENPNFSLMAHLNALASKLHVMATEDTDTSKEVAQVVQQQQEEETARPDVSQLEPQDVTQIKEGEGEPAGLRETDKAHVQVIPRPPEWSLPEDEDSDGDSDHESDYEELSDDENGESNVSDSRVLERGTSLSFPGLQMPGVQLLEVTNLNVTVKCVRCKTECDITNLKPVMPGRPSRPRLGHCGKCSQVMGIGFRKEFVHENLQRLGFFDLAGCTVIEILPSNFSPQCSNCSAVLPPPGIKGLVRGQSITTNCRECHHKMSVFIPETKLLRISYDDDSASSPLFLITKCDAKDTERYVVGTELPLRGRCAHYKKSTRWFRFSCCQKVYPCDKCHDEQVQPQHHAEHANRMICGACSREQNYRPEDCAFCHHSFFRKNTGYWEGGKGTRDRR
ncbi:hypothetical protein RUND412_000101 [Rhizina undulata]